MSTKLLVALALFPVCYAFYSWRLRSHGEQNTAWARQMKATPWRDRRRIAQAVRQGRRLDNPREARLAVGMAEQSLLLDQGLPVLDNVRLIIGTGLILLGLLARTWAVVALGGLFVAFGAAERARAKRLRQRLEQALRLNSEQASLEAGGE